MDTDLKTIVKIAAFCSFALLQGFTTTGYKTGDVVTDFSLKNTDGRIVSTKDYNTAKGLLIVFTCNHCPFARKYEDRLNALNGKYSTKGIPLLAISSNDPVAVPEDAYDKMVTHAREKRYSFPYLFDADQSVAKAFGASKTPHAFLLFHEKGKWILKYKGAIDDNAAEPENVKAHYVEDAINALLNGKPVAVAETKSIGCSIKWKN